VYGWSQTTPTREMQKAVFINATVPHAFAGKVNPSWGYGQQWLQMDVFADLKKKE